MADPPRYWFRAKKRGWGWGAPLTWEGWLLTLGYIALVVCVPAFVSRAVAISITIGATALVLVVVLRKGEPPRYWGSRTKP